MRTAAELTGAVLVTLALLLGCAAAPERYLTLEEDQQMRQSCEAAGCVTVPVPVWMQIQQILQALGMRGT